MSDAQGPDWEALRRAYQRPPNAPPVAIGGAAEDELDRDMGHERFAIMVEAGVSPREAAAYVLKRHKVRIDTQSPALGGALGR